MSVTKQVIGVEEKYKILVDWIARSSYWRSQETVDGIPKAPTSMASASPFLEEIMRVVDDFDYEVPQESHEIKILNHIICDIKNNRGVGSVGHIQGDIRLTNYRESKIGRNKSIKGK